MSKCSYDPKPVTGPIGMFHCPDCGDMVIAGFEHPDMDEVDKRYAEYCDERYERFKQYLRSHLGDGFEDIIRLIDEHTPVKNALMEVWLRADMNEEFLCGRCGKNTFAYRLYCSPFCEKADEIEQEGKSNGK